MNYLKQEYLTAAGHSTVQTIIDTFPMPTDFKKKTPEEKREFFDSSIVGLKKNSGIETDEMELWGENCLEADSYIDIFQNPDLPDLDQIGILWMDVFEQGIGGGCSQVFIIARSGDTELVVVSGDNGPILLQAKWSNVQEFDEALVKYFDGDDSAAILRDPNKK